MNRLPGLHALRLLAALMVFLLHFFFYARELEYLRPGFVLQFGGLAVPLFFTVSAFSLMYSTQAYSGERGWISKFYLKRYFRIAPLFYVMIPVGILIVQLRELTPVGGIAYGPELFLNFFFLFNMVPNLDDSLVLTGWSVGVEMLFYAVFPLIFIFIRSIKASVLLIAGAIIVGEVLRPWLDSLAENFFSSFGDTSVVTNAFYFAYGVLAYHLYDRFSSTAGAKKERARALSFHLACAAVLVGSGWLATLSEGWETGTWRLDLHLWGLALGTLCFWFSTRPFGGLGWAPIQYLGERSYSLYLLHLPIILLLRPVIEGAFAAIHPRVGDVTAAWFITAVVYAVIVGASTVTYAFIERPGMALGRRVARRWSRLSSKPVKV